MEDDLHMAGKVLSTEPLITISKNGDDSRLGIAGCYRDYFRGRRALHLLGLCWTADSSGQVARLAADLENIAGDLPGNDFVVLANTEYESLLLGEAGIPALVASELIFVDENLFYPRSAPFEDIPLCDAVYSARLDSVKRHELTTRIDRPLFIYAQYESGSEAEYRRVRDLVPGAIFANHDLGRGSYRWLAHEEVCALMNRARVGLCLSGIEGAMRSSMEYLMCGLPIVSTPSLGGRDRYFSEPYCSIVDPDPDAVAEAVRLQISRDHDKRAIRSHVSQVIAFDRYNFLLNLNKVVRSILGIDGMFRSFTPFIRDSVYWRPAREVLAELPGDDGMAAP